MKAHSLPFSTEKLMWWPVVSWFLYWSFIWQDTLAKQRQRLINMFLFICLTLKSMGCSVVPLSALSEMITMLDTVCYLISEHLFIPESFLSAITTLTLFRGQRQRCCTVKGCSGSLGRRLTQSVRWYNGSAELALGRNHILHLWDMWPARSVSQELKL